MFIFCLYLFLILLLKRETREVDESLTAHLIEDAYGAQPHMLEIVAKTGQLGYLCLY